MPPLTRALFGHGAALAVVLAALLPFLDDGLFSADEGALLAQLEQLDETGDWRLPNPAPQLDPALQAVPMELSYRSPATGDAGAWAPFAKHAAHVAVLRVPFAKGGLAGVQAVGIAGTVAAAVAAGLLAARLDPRAGAWALWATGLGTPLLFDSYLAMGHTLAAGLAGMAAVATVRAVDRSRPGDLPVAPLAAAALLAGACVLIRSEGVFVAPALAAGVLAAGGRRLAVSAAVLLVSAPVVHLVNEAIDAVVWPDPAPSVSAADRPEYGLVDGRAEGFIATWLDPADDRDGAAAAGFVGAAATWGAVVVARRRGSPAVVAALGGAAVVLVVARAAGNATAIPGLLVACPLLAGLAGVERLRRWDATARVLGTTAAVYALAVLATQYPEGGTGEWGGRYFALALPIVVPLAVAGLTRLVSTEGARAASRVAVVAVVAVSAVVAVEAVSTLDASQERATEVVDLLVDLRAEVSDGEPVPVVTTSGAIARFAWEHIDDGAWHTTTRARLPDLADGLAAGGDDTLVLFTQAPEEDVALLTPRWEVEAVPQSALLYVLRARR